MNNTGNNKRIAQNTIFLYIRMIVVLFVSIYTTRVVLNVLGVVDFGVYNVVCGFVAMFSFFNASMSNGIQRFYNYEAGSNNSQNITKVYRTSLIIQFILALILLVLLETIGLWYVNTKMELAPGTQTAANIVFQCSVVSLIFIILQVPYSAAILAHERMGYYSVISIIDVFLKLIIVLVLPYVSFNKLSFYGFLQLLIAIFDFLLYYIYAKRNFSELKFSFETDKSLFKSIFSFSSWNILGMFAWTTQGQGLNMVINLFFGPVVNAARGVSAQIQSAIQGFCENLVIAFRPQLVQSYSQGNIVRTRNMMYSMSKIMFLLFFILSTPIIFDINYILKLWLGDSVPEYTAQFTILILLSMYPRNFALAFTQVVHATGQIKNYELISSSIVILVLPLSYLALKLGSGVVTVFLVNLVVCTLMFLICMIYLKKIFSYSIAEYLKEVIIPCLFMAIISLFVPICSSYILHGSLFRLIINFCLGGLVSLMLAYKLILNENEKELIRKMIFRK